MMSNLPIIDSSFSTSKLPLYEISIQLKLNGYSLFIKDISSSKFIYFDEFQIPELNPTQIEWKEEYYCQFFFDFIGKQNFGNKSFRNVKILFHQPEVFVIPAAMHSSDANATLFHIQFPELKDCFVEDIIINELDAKVQFAISDCLYRILVNQFDQFKSYHALGILIEQALLKSNYPGEPVLFIDIQNSVFHLAGFHKNQMLISHSQSYNQTEEIFYQLANIKQLVFKGMPSVNLVVGGESFSYPAFIDWAKVYFAGVNWWEQNHQPSFSPALLEIAPIKYNLLLSLDRCE